MSKTLAAGRKPDLAGMRILVAEDEAVIAMMVEDTLIDAGALVLGPVISVQDGLQMVEVAMGDGGISAAVLDLQLGDGKAARLADTLRERGVPFLFATGYDGHPDLDGHRDVPVLCKPYNPEDLVRIVENLCHAGAPASLPARSALA